MEIMAGYKLTAHTSEFSKRLIVSRNPKTVKCQRNCDGPEWQQAI